MSKIIKILGLIIATTGLAYVVKLIMHHREHSTGWHKVKVDDKKRTGTRYGSNPVQY